MAGPRPWRATGVALLALSLLAAAPAGATSLQVAPTSLQLEARQRAGELWLTNSGTSPVRLQVRVFRWVQQDGREQLLPTEELLATPPMQELGRASSSWYGSCARTTNRLRHSSTTG